MLQSFSDWIVYSLLGVEAGSSLGNALNFFVYDTVKILLMLYVMIGVIGVFRTYVSQKRIRHSLSEKRGGLSYVIASIFGAITPFCSCSSVPIFMSFIKAGVPLGPTFSFLVTSPLLNEYVAILMLGFFGLRITVAYIVFGLFLGVISGLLINRLKLERFIAEEFRYNDNGVEEAEYKKFRDRIDFGLQEASSIVRKLFFWVVLGVGIGAGIHGFVPEEIIHNLLDKTGIFSVPLAALIGIPIYANCGAVVPIAVVLFNKGVPLGTALAFVMSTAALSLPEAIILRRVMKLHLIAAFFAIVAAGIILIGYIFNFIS